MGRRNSLGPQERRISIRDGVVEECRLRRVTPAVETRDHRRFAARGGRAGLDAVGLRGKPVARTCSTISGHDVSRQAGWDSA